MARVSGHTNANARLVAPVLRRGRGGAELLFAPLDARPLGRVKCAPNDLSPNVGKLRDSRSLEAFLEHLSAWGAELDQLGAAAPEDVVVVLRYISRVARQVPFDLGRLLHARFGDLDAAAEQRIASASLEELDRWVDRVVTATDIDDILSA